MRAATDVIGPERPERDHAGRSALNRQFEQAGRLRAINPLRDRER